MIDERFFLNMDFDSEDEIDLVLLAVALIKCKKKRKKRRIWVQDMYKNRDTEGINRIVAGMKLSNRDLFIVEAWVLPYLLSQFLFLFYINSLASHVCCVALLR